MNLLGVGSAKLPSYVAFITVALAITSVTFVECNLLSKHDPPKPVKISCLGCHSDKRTLKAIADKADDPLYLVHDGQLTLAQLNKLTGENNDPSVARSSKPLKECPVYKPGNLKSTTVNK